MASERQIEANRSNAQKSTGPKSRAGRNRASKNAYRHGLSAGILPDADWIKKIEAFAKKIVDSTGGQIGLGRARSIAHAELEVQRTRSISTALVRQILADCDPSMTAKETDRTAEAIGRALSALKVLDRYESRAVARRDKAVHKTEKEVAMR